MTRVPVPTMRSVIEQGPRGLQVTVPTRRNIFVMLFLPVWLVGWFFGEVSVASQLLTGEFSPFLVAWLAMWTLGGVFCVAMLLWMIAGKEVITFGRGVVTHRYDVLGIGRTKEYDLAHVRELSVSAESFNMWNMGGGFRFYGLGGGPISFDYGAKTVRMAAGVDEAEARAIVDKIKANVRLSDHVGTAHAG